MSTNVLSDMDDSADLPESQPLRNILSFCQEELLPAFRRSNSEAIGLQQKHRWVTRWVAVLGAAATILAIFQLFAAAIGLKEISWLRWVELGSVILMFVLLLYAHLSDVKQSWLLERYKAERLRLLKFRFILEPALWSGDEKRIASAQEKLHEDAGKITDAIDADLDGWLSQAVVPAVWDAPSSELPAETLDALRHYYHLKRLGFQMRYLSWAKKRYVERDHKTRALLLILFFGSAIFVVVHSAVDVARVKLSWSLVFLAAILPALVTPLRTIRLAYESARNATRYVAFYSTLEGLSDRLDNAVTTAAVFRELGFCEQVFEADHREWMRLMKDAEWFG